MKGQYHDITTEAKAGDNQTECSPSIYKNMILSVVGTRIVFSTADKCTFV